MARKTGLQRTELEALGVASASETQVTSYGGSSLSALKRLFCDRLDDSFSEAENKLWALNRVHGHCLYCGRELAKLKGGVWVKLPTVKIEWDHLYPTSRWGLRTKGNFFPACSECNGQKSDMMPVEYFRQRKVGLHETFIDSEQDFDAFIRELQTPYRERWPEHYELVENPPALTPWEILISMFFEWPDNSFEQQFNTAGRRVVESESSLWAFVEQVRDEVMADSHADEDSLHMRNKLSFAETWFVTLKEKAGSVDFEDVTLYILRNSIWSLMWRAHKSGGRFHYAKNYGLHAVAVVKELRGDSEAAKLEHMFSFLPSFEANKARRAKFEAAKEDRA